MSRKLWGFTTDLGRVVPAEVLDDYSTKQDSQQLPPDPVFTDVRGVLAPKYDPHQLAGLLELNTAHLVACRQKAEDVLGSGWDWEQTREDAQTQGRDRLAALFDSVPRPESAFDSHSVREVLIAAQVDYESMGRGALELVREGGPSSPVAAIYHVPAQTLRIARDGVKFMQSRGGIRRWFKWAGASIDVDFETGQTTDLGGMPPRRRATEIVWWRQYHPRDPVYGMPDVIPAIGAIHGDIGRRNYNIDFFANYGIPAYAVYITGDFDPGKMVDENGAVVADDSPDAVMTETEYHVHKLLDEVRRNPHASLVLAVPTRDNESGTSDGKVEIKFEPLSTEVKEASFRMYRRDNREEVLSSHRMSSAIAGVFDQGQANREARSQYRQAVVQPRRATLQQVVNEYIVATFGDIGWRWKLSAADSRDADAVLERVDKAVRAGTITPREARRIVARVLGMPADVPQVSEDPALDRFYVNGAPLGESADGPAGGVDQAAELRALRSDLVTMALKASRNGGTTASPELFLGD